ncbi:hypothetical protein BASA83_007326 [Batrachochytrium salamandrivorans]|nr:hypothetical protein BASA83_007326 [Batrachochytrium salamandrivorans]
MRLSRKALPSFGSSGCCPSLCIYRCCCHCYQVQVCHHFFSCPSPRDDDSSRLLQSSWIRVFSQVAAHQRVTSLPNVGVAQEGIAKFFQAFSNGEWKKVTLAQTVSFGLEGVKIYGFFLVGEMIGRGSIVGYNIEGSGSHGGHH